MKLRFFLSVSLLVGFLVGCGPASEEVTEEIGKREVEVVKAEKKGYVQSYETNGVLEGEDTTQIAARQGGVVKEVLVEEGGWVEEGQELFRYDEAGGEKEAEIALKQAEVSLNSARNSLMNSTQAAQAAKDNASQAVKIAEQSLATVKEETDMAVQQARKSLTATENSLQELKDMNQRNIALAEEGVRMAEVAYNSAVDNRVNVESQGSLSTRHSDEMAEVVPLQVWPAIQDGLTVGDELLGVSNMREDNARNYEIYLKAMDIERYSRAKQNLRGLWERGKELEDKVDASANKENLEKFRQMVLDTKVLMNELGMILDEAQVGSSFSETMRVSYRGRVTAAQQALEGARAVVQGAIQGLESTDLSTDVQVVTARNAEDSAEASLNQARVSLESSKGQAKNSEVNAELSLLAAKNGLESALTAQRNRVQQAELQLENARKNYNLVVAQQNSAVQAARNQVQAAQVAKENVQNNYFAQLERSPVSGYLVDFNVEPGKTVGRGVNFGKIVKTEQLKIDFEVPVEIAGILGVGMGGRVMCANENEVGFEVKMVEKVAGGNHMVDVEAILSEGGMDQCKVGELVKIYLEIEREPEVQVPLSALVWRASNPVVWLIKDGKLEVRRVELEEMTNGSAVMKNGVEEGEEVVINPEQDFKAGEEVLVKNN